MRSMVAWCRFSECAYHGVHRASSASDPNFDTDCFTLSPADKKTKNTEKPTDDYSFGNLDDFCLHTQVSDEKSLRESRGRRYRGIGSEFTTLFAFNLHFQHIEINLQENEVHHSKERKILV
jgi:hypothetical protein